MGNSYKDSMKSTGLVGGIEIIRLVFGLLRNKVIALYFGPTGLGVWGLFQSFIDMIQSASSLGFEKSAVKKISENQESEYERKLTMQCVQFCVIAFSLICSLGVALFSVEFSINIFGTPKYDVGVLVCCLIVIVNSAAAAYRSILNGLGEIKALAISQLNGVVVGNIVVCILVLFSDKALAISQIAGDVIENSLKYILVIFSDEAFAISQLAGDTIRNVIRGIFVFIGDGVLFPLYLLIISVSALIPTLIFFRRLKSPYFKVSFRGMFESFSSLMKIGLAFWVSSFFLMLINYLINIFLKKELSLEAVGVYQASWTLSNMYIGIVLSSMGVVFFPKICRVITNKSESSKLINEQIELGLLISLPVVIFMFIFAPFLLMLFYSSEFKIGDSIMRWLMLGVVMRMIGFPLGYALMAKEKSIQYVLSQLFFSVFNYIFIILLVIKFGLEWLGFNYFLAYFMYAIMVGIFCYKSIDYKPSFFLLKVVLMYLMMIAVSIYIVYAFDGVLFVLFGLFVVLISAIYSYRVLCHNLKFDLISYLKVKLKI